jgi:hypothetical protein
MFIAAGRRGAVSMGWNLVSVPNNPLSGQRDNERNAAAFRSNYDPIG